jgi:hypothetical protein
MAKDNRGFSKPYLSGDKEYLEVYNKRTFEEGDPTGNTEYSEGQTPYTEEFDWPTWEWSWPDTPFPVPPPIVGDPDLTDHPCNEEFKCSGAAILGPDKLECPSLSIYNQAHVIVGCSVAPAWAAFGSWEITENYDDAIFIASQSPISCTIEVPIGVQDGEIVLTYFGPLECTVEKRITVDCGCCTGLYITGSDTILNWQEYEVTLTPPCPQAVGVVTWLTPSCDPELGDIWVLAPGPVTSGDGEKITFEFDADNACGSFRLTVTDMGADCGGSVSIDVRIGASAAGGAWEEFDNSEEARGCYWFNCGFPIHVPCGVPEPCKGSSGGIWDSEGNEIESATEGYRRYGSNSESDCVMNVAQWCGACSQCDGNPGDQTYGGNCGCTAPPSPPVIIPPGAVNAGMCANDPWGTNYNPAHCCWTNQQSDMAVAMWDYDVCEWTCECPE